MQTIKKNTVGYIIAASIVIVIILLLGTLWVGQSTKKDTDKAVRTVSLLYLDELAGRREQVVENNLNNSIQTIQIAIGLLDEYDLDTKEHLENYQSNMKKLYKLDKFAFVDDDGLIYTSVGYQDNIEDYDFDYRNLTEPEVSILNPNSEDKKVIIAVPTDLMLEGKHLKVCFEEIDMKVMLAGLSMESSENDATFCNIYTTDGIALSDTILGGLSAEDNLLDAMKIAEFDDGYSYDDFIKSFTAGEDGEVTFTYKGINETLSYAPVKGTDWQLTYLVRESVIGDSVNYISEDIVN